MRYFIIYFLIYANSCLNVNAQNIYNTYQDWSGQPESSFDIITTNPYTGEYQIFSHNLHWDVIQGLGLNDNFDLSNQMSFKLESVSFPFVPDLNLSDGSTRILSLPDASTYDPVANTWTICNGEQTVYQSVRDCNENLAPKFAQNPPDCMFCISASRSNLASIIFKDLGTGPNGCFNLPTGSEAQTIYPHSVHKMTIYYHCSTECDDNEIIDQMEFVIDFSRGKMREYPYYDCNFCASLPEPQFYDIALYPTFYLPPSFDATSNFQMTIDYFPNQGIDPLACGSYYLNIANPEVTYFYPTPQITASYSPLNFIHPPPFALPGYYLGQERGDAPIGYEVVNGQFTPLPGIQHDYKIIQNFDFTIINPEEKVIYNPSEVSIEADNLIFPENYSFKTVRGLYPTAAEVQAADAFDLINDKREVYVYTDLSSDPVDASHYYIESGAKLTIEPCVTIYDATIHVKSGGELVYDPRNLKGNVKILPESGSNVQEVSYDDYCGNDCYTSVRWDVDDETISENTSWTTSNIGDNGLYKILNTLTIESGAQLTLSPGVILEFGPQGAIIVEKGAKFIATGATVRGNANCNEAWNGILVMGDETATQPLSPGLSSPDQGVAWFRVSATLEDALYGITAADDFGSISGGGGLIWAEASSFHNNGSSINFGKYQNPNHSRIDGCTFTWSARPTIGGNEFNLDAHVIMHEVNGVEIENSRFGAGSISADITAADEVTGVYSMNATYDAISNNFDDLFYGIESEGFANFTDILTIRQNIFNNIQRGVYLGGIEYADVLLNNFDIPTQPSNDYEFPYGLYLDGVNHYHVEANNLTGVYPITIAHGMIINNLMEEGTLLYRNDFSNLLFGSTVMGNNGGLQIKCNDYFVDNIMNIFVVKGNGEDPELPNQGECPQPGDLFPERLPAGNVFADFASGCTYPNYHIFTRPEVQIFRYSHHDSDETTPECLSMPSSVNPELCPGLPYNFSTACPEEFSLPSPCSPEPCVDRIDVHKNNIADLVKLYDGGDQQSLFDGIFDTSISSDSLKTLLVDAGPYLTDTVLAETIKRDTNWDDNDLEEVLTDNAPLTSAMLNLLQVERPSVYPDIAAIGGVSEREKLDRKIRFHEIQVEILIAKQVKYYYAVAEYDSLETFLRNENTDYANKVLIAFWLFEKDYTNARSTLLSLPQVTDQEKQFVDLQTMIVDTLAIYGDYQAMSRLPELAIKDIAATLTPSGIKANYLLNYFFNTDYEEFIPDLDDTTTASLIAQRPKPVHVEVPREMSRFQQNKKPLFDIFPNPTSGILTIEISLPEEEGIGKVDIFNVYGIKSQSFKFDGAGRHAQKVSLDALPAGVYLIHFSIGGRSIKIKKLILTK